MPISGIGSRIPTVDAFITHWNSVNTLINPTVLTLSGGYAVGDLETDRDDQLTFINDVEVTDNAMQEAAGERDVRRAIMQPRLVQFNAAVRGLLPGSRHLKTMAKVPAFGDGIGIWRKVVADIGNQWVRINTNNPAVAGFTPPLKLSGNYLVAGFNTDAGLLESAHSSWSDKEQLAAQQRTIRDEHWAGIYAKLKQYRNVCIGLLAPDSALINSIPRLTPLPGSTPPAVNLGGIFDEDLKLGVLSWTASTFPAFDHYEIRACSGSKYLAANEQVVDQTNDLEYQTDFGLVANGSSMFFKVYVITTTANEKGSNAVKIIRTSD